MQSSYIDVTKCYLFYTSNKLIVVQYFGPILCSISPTQVKSAIKIGWLVGSFGLNGPLRQYCSLYLAISQREGERAEKG